MPVTRLYRFGKCDLPCGLRISLCTLQLFRSVVAPTLCVILKAIRCPSRSFLRAVCALFLLSSRSTSFTSSSIVATLGRGGLRRELSRTVVSPCPIETFTLLEAPSFLGALTACASAAPTKIEHSFRLAKLQISKIIATAADKASAACAVRRLPAPIF
jgi:hypothetical protein